MTPQYLAAFCRRSRSSRSLKVFLSPNLQIRLSVRYLLCLLVLLIHTAAFPLGLGFCAHKYNVDRLTPRSLSYRLADRSKLSSYNATASLFIHPTSNSTLGVKIDYPFPNQTVRKLGVHQTRKTPRKSL